MPTGRSLSYKRYTWEQLQTGVTLEPPRDAHRAYVMSEGGIVRWCCSSDGSSAELSTTVGMPLIEGFPEEFDTDLQYLHFKSGAQGVCLHVYYYRSS